MEAQAPPRTLLLLRHARATRDHTGDDFERGLTARGERQATLVGRCLQREGWVPDLILCSAARRAVDTWTLAARVLGGDVPVRTGRSLFMAPPSELLAAIRSASREVRTLLLVGHNPALEDLAIRLCADGPAEALERLRAGVPTAGLVRMSFRAREWHDVAERGGTLERFVVPEDLE